MEREISPFVVIIVYGTARSWEYTSL